MKKNLFIIPSYIIVTLALISCDIKPQEINYGVDHCYNCDMTVVDKTHSAEYVTKKGKAYVFDAIECLMMKMNKDQNENQIALILVANFTNPGDLIDAKNATYLISEKIKSPMGANLSAFSSKEEAETIMKENGGQLYTWEELKLKYNK